MVTRALAPAASNSTPEALLGLSSRACLHTRRRSWPRRPILAHQTPSTARNDYPHITRSTSTSSFTSSTSGTETPRTIFSGIQPTGTLHLGNYLGALKPFVSLQNRSPPSTNLYYSVVDIHSRYSLSPPTDHASAVKSTLAAFLAAGLSPERSTIFIQRQVHQHAELAAILASVVNKGALERMPQWKSKVGVDEDGEIMDPEKADALSVGLFTYPVLQAADILLYGTTHVPVGSDQAPHVELARIAARRFNSKYGGGGRRGADGRTLAAEQILTPPETLVSSAARVRSLTHPELKMSKSQGIGRSRIEITDSERRIWKKVREAVTDDVDEVTYDPVNRPGVANLLEIMAQLEGGRGGRVGGETGSSGRVVSGAASNENDTTTTPQEIATSFATLPTKTKAHPMRILKDRVAKFIELELRPVREAYEHLTQAKMGERVLKDAAEKGRVKAQRTAKERMEVVEGAMGCWP
ncbi:MAG: 28S ribosomal protein S10, mitochondrial [Alyxoria varia]|nr:MAG: 28S ribosomal protein S10, mitochondrial [Alyxoria varia]